MDITPKLQKTFVKGLPKQMSMYDHWIVWKLEQKIGKDKPDKIPYNPHNGQRASSTDSKTWGTFDDTVAVYNTGTYDGIGFVFDRSDPYIFIDIDHCINEFGKITGEAWRDVKLFNTYTEISQSGTGIHIIGMGSNPGGDHKGHKNGNIEFYTQGRFVAMTGHIYTDCDNGQKWENITYQPYSMLRPFYKHYFSKPEVINKALVKSQGKINVSSNDLSDEDVIKICGYAKNSPKFESLWRGDISGYNSPSEADMALVSILTFYTRDPNQLQRLLLRSGLNRDKHNRADYITRTIEAALSTVTETFTAKPTVCYKCKTEYENKESTTCKKCGRSRRY